MECDAVPIPAKPWRAVTQVLVGALAAAFPPRPPPPIFRGHTTNTEKSFKQ
jgi:hypothetical protein